MPIAPMKPTPQLVVMGLFILAIIGAIGLTWLVALVRYLDHKPLLPDRPTRLVPWGGWSILLLVILWAGIQTAVYYTTIQKPKPAGAAPPAAAAKGEKAKPPSLSPRDEVILMAIVSLFLVPLVPMTLRATCRATRNDLGLSTFRFSDVGFGILGCLFVLPITAILMIVLSRFMKATPHKLIEAVQEDPTGMMALLAIFSAVVAAPIVEELFFRGVILGWLHTLGSVTKPIKADEVVLENDDLLRSQDSPYMAPTATVEPQSGSLLQGFLGMHGGWIVPNVFTSLVFAGLHFEQWPAPIPLFPLSLMLGYLYRRTGSLIAPIAMHATFNGINMALLFLAIWAGAPIGKPAEKAPVVDPVGERVNRSGANSQDFLISDMNSPWRRLDQSLE